MAEHPRRIAALALAALLAAGLGACSDDGGAEPSDEPSEESTDDRDRDADGDDDPGDEGESGDEDEPGDGEDVELLEPADLPAEAVPFADALAGTLATQGAFTSATPAEARCLATNVVAVVGAERFADAGITPEEFGATPDLAATGIDRAAAEAIYDVFAGCGVDYAAATIESIALEASDQAAARACLDDALDAGAVRELAIASLLDTVEESEDATEALAAIEACTAPDQG